MRRTEGCGGKGGGCYVSMEEVGGWIISLVAQATTTLCMYIKAIVTANDVQ